MKRAIKSIIFCLIWMASDFYINHLTRVNPWWGKMSQYTDHTHYFLYGLLGLYACFSQDPIAFFLFLFWCFADEGLQFFMPNRVPDLLDVVRNVIGFLSGYLILDLFFKWKTERVNKK